MCYKNLFSHAKLSETLRDDTPVVTYPIGLEGSELTNILERCQISEVGENRQTKQKPLSLQTYLKILPAISLPYHNSKAGFFF